MPLVFFRTFAAWLLLLVVLLGGCGGGEASPAAPPDTSPRQQFYAPGLAADVYLPATFAAARPAVLLLHGGGWGAGDRGEFADLARWLAAQGVVAVAIDYRLTTAGYRWPAQLEDARHAVWWMRMHAGDLGIDPQRIAALGGSAGGLLAAWLAVDDAHDAAGRSDRVQAAVSLWGPWDLTQPDDSLLPDARGMLESLLGPGRPGARDASPYFRIAADSAPVLLVHGLDDRLVPPIQSQRACARYRELGARCDLLELPGEGHGLARSEDVNRVTEAVRAFLGRELLARR
ncbi:alpha/beta hydrolase [Niveibacterium umoris]|uniref:Acetyl esterase/lipase n=1 Tax=Niveibacterium umoris TaxID=1193620 RepID=A0A840BR93_9RHOO|nr:alpha/beta hydrolase fold domain-containing protein [Niveibacterium umoris]MBB4013979.1 acetyl esterase/lipase [Niveibacterium umoris]